MGRKKINKPRRRRKDRTALDRYAASYSCGHCHSAPSWARGPNGIGHAIVRHDDTCPVLAGSLSDLPDALRAAEATHGIVVLVGDRHFTVHGSPEEKAAVLAAALDKWGL
ncbi:hypothetical protein [Streptomyces swartbergensis]|uniref:hypothetical protein n=1 Tax=Streptomyces swartbergensis TaxID=487165 RepID=UPI00380A2277